ncbi:TPA: entry exclusion lipoprotein TrbK [Pseudomonas aeruginosa]
MKRMPPLLLLAALTACGPSETPKQANVPTVGELATDQARLKELRQQCKTDRATLGDVLCNRVAEATRKRFYGDGKTPYTPSETSPKF